ncbi:MAG: Type 3 secretion system secretin [Chlamydiales bacterium]|nr:Type 3 secretion system secretin [Chlamydiales bacterium]
MKRRFFLLMALLLVVTGQAQTIAEKKESFQRSDNEMDSVTLEQLRSINEELDEKRHTLKRLYDQALQLYHTHADKQRYLPILQKAALIKEEIAETQRMWRLETAAFMPNEEYALWHQPETTLQQLVMDYGAPDFIYLVPPEVGGMRMSLNSSLPIPRESWGECLELILAQYGIGIRELNPYLRELFIVRNDPSGIKAIVDQTEQLDFYSPQARVCYLLSPDGTDPRGDLFFLEKFSNPSTTKVEILGGKIFITASVDTIQELLKLYSFAKSGNRGQDFQLVSLSKIDASEMETILNSAFHDGNISVDGSTLRVIPLNNLSQSLFLTGTKEDVKKAQRLIQDVESQIEDPQEKTVFWYTTKHSEAEELATVLAKVYDLLVGTESIKTVNGEKSEKTKDSHLVVPAINVGPSSDKRTSHKTADGQNNFIVDPKTGAIIMVVEQEALPKIKELLKKLDVPKKMVQIEVLLLEKKVSNSNKFGLNLLRLGSQAGQVASTGLNWGTGGAGILEFLISRSKGSGIPAYDLAYQFMLGQEDVQINASPSVTTINQTPATIAIVEEISIDKGADKKDNRIYDRAQYGITLQITPTINMDEGDLSESFITLDTDITFDTTKKSTNDRPDVTRRHIKNHVRIADGQTVILGGLRRKNSQDSKDSIPFLGEIPGIGKLFSHTEMVDSSTEMFVFITPKIIADPIEDAEKFRRDELKKRPGDVPEFLHELVEAQSRERKCLFEQSLTALFGRDLNPTATINNRKRTGEYDGR